MTDHVRAQKEMDVESDRVVDSNTNYMKYNKANT